MIHAWRFVTGLLWLLRTSFYQTVLRWRLRIIDRDTRCYGALGSSVKTYSAKVRLASYFRLLQCLLPRFSEWEYEWAKGDFGF